MSAHAKTKAKFNFKEGVSALFTQHVFPFIKKNAVLCIAILAALVTSFIVPPDAQYLEYFDWKTLTCLFCVLAVVGAFKNIQFFFVLAEKIVKILRKCLSGDILIDH